MSDASVAGKTAVLIATAGGAGFVPAMPGTAGALVGVGIFALAVWSGLLWLYLPLLVILTIAGTWAAGRVEEVYGHDAASIVIDEVVGQMIALAVVAGTILAEIVPLTILGFLLFRFFDILKPFPIRRLEKLPGGVGVMADDVGAGIYALLVLLATEPFIAEIV
jgi:phosphatidylglycerophosphatase A